MSDSPDFHHYSRLLVKKFASLQAKYDSEPQSEQKAKITEARKRYFEWASKVDLSGKLTKVPLEDRLDFGSEIMVFKLTLERISDIVYTLDNYFGCGELDDLHCRLSGLVRRDLNSPDVSDKVKIERRIQKLCDDIDYLYANKLAIEFEVSRLIQIQFR